MSKDELLGLAWGIIANVDGGNWDKQSVDLGWRKAAKRWMDEYHKQLPKPLLGAEVCEWPAVFKAPPNKKP